MTTQIKYVPILKWKAAEICALTHTSDEHKKIIIPLIEIVLPSVNAYKDKERKKKKTDEEIHSEMVEKMIAKRILEIPEEIKEAWGNLGIYVDVTLLHNKDKTTELKIMVLNTILDGAKTKGLKVIPVINVADDSSIVSNLANLISRKEVEEICLRVTPSNLKNSDMLDAKISTLLSLMGIEKNRVHLLVDLKYVDTSTGTYGTIFTQAQKIKDLGQFKEFIFASGAFPVDMSECSFEDLTYLPRTDWTSWKGNVTEGKIIRRPIYSDYSIRHPFHNDSLQFFESTSTLKYTVDAQWMIMKGKKRALEMYLTHAYLLVQHPEFKLATYGKEAAFSFGDDYIVKKAKHFNDVFRYNNSAKGMGRTSDWITAGISHHLAVVMHQLSTHLD